MTISRLELQGQIPRVQDFTTQKQNEDNKGMVDQTHFQRQFDQEVDAKIHQVQQGEQAENTEKRYDAKEKGNGNYQGDGGRRRRKDEKEPEEKVIIKGHGSFDMKI